MSETTSATPDPLQQVRLRVKQKVDFYGHLTVYLIAMGMMAGINLLTNPARLWFIWPLLGWGVAILFHFVGTFLFGEGTPLQRRIFERELRHLPR